MQNLQGESLGSLLLLVPLAVSAKSLFNIFDFVHGPL
jgi:hypothetical protein